MGGSRVYSAVLGYILRFSGMAEIRQENDSESSDVDILEASLDN
jgi:hypothetical protein